jgi:hypothetical protein
MALLFLGAGAGKNLDWLALLQQRDAEGSLNG